jgi:hypothetical protein
MWRNNEIDRFGHVAGLTAPILDKDKKKRTGANVESPRQSDARVAEKPLISGITRCGAVSGEGIIGAAPIANPSQPVTRVTGRVGM